MESEAHPYCRENILHFLRYQKDIGGVDGLTDASCRTYLTQIVNVKYSRLRISCLRHADWADSLHLMTEVLFCQRCREKY